jgi:hypothetical protein
MKEGIYTSSLPVIHRNPGWTDLTFRSSTKGDDERGGIGCVGLVAAVIVVVLLVIVARIMQGYVVTSDPVSLAILVVFSIVIVCIGLMKLSDRIN